MARYMAAVSAFFLSGRSIWISTTPSSSTSTMPSLTILLLETIKMDSWPMMTAASILCRVFSAHRLHESAEIDPGPLPTAADRHGCAGVAAPRAWPGRAGGEHRRRHRHRAAVFPSWREAVAGGD